MSTMMMVAMATLVMSTTARRAMFVTTTQEMQQKKTLYRARGHARPPRTSRHKWWRRACARKA